MKLSYGLSIHFLPDISFEQMAPQESDIQTDLEKKKVDSYNLVGEQQRMWDTVQKTLTFEQITITESQDATIVVNHGGLIIDVASNCKVTLRIVRKAQTQYAADAIIIRAKKDADVHVIGMNADSKKTHSFCYRKAHVKENATVSWTELVIGAAYQNLHIVNNLEGEQAKGNITVLSLTKNLHDVYTESHHLARNSHSDIKTRAVIVESGKNLSRGLVKIAENAFGSNGYEQQDALMLTNTCEADAIPNLEIHNHDVKCSHGSTVGKVDPMHMYYLQSRGLSKQEAQKHIIKSYFAPILAIVSGDVKQLVDKELEAAL